MGQSERTLQSFLILQKKQYLWKFDGEADQDNERTISK